VTGREVTPAQLKRRLPAEQQREVDAALTAGMGCALYVEDVVGGAVVLVTYNGREANIPGPFPPATNGWGMTLGDFVAPPQQAPTMRSPLMNWQQPRQIQAPARGPSQTAYPNVLISGRSSRHPRGDAELLLPGRRSPVSEEPAPTPPSAPSAPQTEPVSEEAAWWSRHLG
jgi:hypothetical protein